jgi:hypothetical protein
MKALSKHCCPVCGDSIGANRWFWRSWIWTRWHCSSCGSLLRFNFRQRLKVGLLVLLFDAAVLAMGVFLLVSRISPWIWAIPICGIYLWGTILIFARWDKIILATK